jgi:GTP cyclohydrolase II
MAHLISISETCSIMRGKMEWNLNVWRFLGAPEKEYEVICLYHGAVKDGVLIRVNSPCLTSEVFGDEGRCDCKQQLDNAFRLMEENKEGMIIYPLHEEGRGHGISHKVNSYHLMSKYQISTKEAFVRLGLVPDIRNYDYLGNIFSHFQLRAVSLLTNNLRKIDAIESLGGEGQQDSALHRRSQAGTILGIEDTRTEQYSVAGWKHGKNNRNRFCPSRGARPRYK